MSALKALADALDGDAYGRYVLAPGPGHSKDDRSMQVSIDRTAPSGVRVHSWAGDSWRDCLDHVKSRLGITDTKPERSFARQPETSRRHDIPADNTERTAGALAIWNAACADRGHARVDPP